MSPIESLPVGIDGLALAWESVAALLGALGLGLAAGVLVRARRSRRPPRPIAAERERELESLRRIAAELAQTSDVGGGRSEERRVGEECRSRWSPDHLK